MNTLFVVTILLIRIEGDHAMPMKDVRRMCEIARERFEKIGIKIEFRHQTGTVTYYPTYETARADYAYLANHYQQYRENVHVLVPPLEDEEGRLWSWGKAEPGSYGLAGFSFSTATLKNHDGKGRFIASTQALLHEIAHQLGARHTKKTSTMHQEALRLATERSKILGWTNQTKREIWTHLKISKSTN